MEKATGCMFPFPPHPPQCIVLPPKGKAGLSISWLPGGGGNLAEAHQGLQTVTFKLGVLVLSVVLVGKLHTVHCPEMESQLRVLALSSSLCDNDGNTP